MRGVPPNVRATSWSVRSGGAAICASVTPPAGGCKVIGRGPRVDACRSLWSLSGPSAGPPHDAYETPAPLGADLGFAGDRDLDVHGGVASSRPRGGGYRSGDPPGAPRGLRAGADFRRGSKPASRRRRNDVDPDLQHAQLQHLFAVPAAQSAVSHFHRGAGCRRSGEMLARRAARGRSPLRGSSLFQVLHGEPGFRGGGVYAAIQRGRRRRATGPAAIPPDLERRRQDDRPHRRGARPEVARREAAGAGPADRRVDYDRRSQRRHHRPRAPPRALRRNPHSRTVHEICARRPRGLVRDREPGRRSAHSRLHSGDGLSGWHLRQRRLFVKGRLSAPSTALPIAVS